MRKLGFVIITLFIYNCINAQNYELKELSRRFKKRDYSYVIQKGKDLLEHDSDNTEINSIIGRSMQAIGKHKESINYLQKAVLTNNPKSYSKAWALNSLACSYFVLRKDDLSKECLLKSIEMNVTRNSFNNAKYLENLLGFGNFYDNWIRYENEHFIYHFQDSLRMKHFIARREPVYDSICKFFHVKMENKINYIVWTSKKDAKEILNSNIGFSKPDINLIHSAKNQSLGHEMTHVISHYAYDEIYKTALINEGIAVYLDFNQVDLRQEVISSMKGMDIKKISVKKYWKNWWDYSYKISYPLAGLFVKQMIDEYGHEKFLQFFKDQTYQNALTVFGEDFKVFISDFEDQFNS